MASRRPLGERLREVFPEKTKKDIYAAVLCGEIRADGETVRDLRQPVSVHAELTWESSPYVSRGGLKLQGVLDAWHINPEGLVCLDAGASTGGFTHCLLTRGARQVHAVDVGRNQLAWRLRQDPRVLVREKTNIMGLVPGDLQPPPSLGVADLSFRSLRGAAAKLLSLTAGGPLIALAKPQFEAPREESFDGVVRDPALRTKIMLSLAEDLAAEGAYVKDAFVSLVRGRRGNVEIFLLLSSRPPSPPQEGKAALAAALASLA